MALTHLASIFAPRFLRNIKWNVVLGRQANYMQ